MIVADSIHLVRFVRGYWKYLVAVVVVLFAVEMANDCVNFDRRALSPTSILPGWEWHAGRDSTTRFARKSNPRLRSIKGPSR